uniref:Uncharacterized protein n=1 Tax=Monodon monoceros TaxID=40151 RepID=A0A8C6AL95_MONMO
IRTMMPNNATSHRCENPHPGHISREQNSGRGVLEQVISFLPDEISTSVKEG